MSYEGLQENFVLMSNQLKKEALQKFSCEKNLQLEETKTVLKRKLSTNSRQKKEKLNLKTSSNFYEKFRNLNPNSNMVDSNNTFNNLSEKSFGNIIFVLIFMLM